MTTTYTTKQCPDCGGNGSFVTDYHDPGDFHGHGQYESECERCEGTGEVEDNDEDEE